MPYTFTAAVDQQATIFTADAKVTVTLQIDDVSSIPVAQIDDFVDPCDHRSTAIRYAEGGLHFSAAYDGPLRPHTILPFEGSDIALHTFDYAKSGVRFCLCANDGFFPIIAEENTADFKITVYKSLPAQLESGLLYPVLAQITQTRTHAKGFDYEIQTDELLPLPLLAAVFSLPFTLNLCNHPNPSDRIDPWGDDTIWQTK